VEVRIDGFEDEVRRIVREEITARDGGFLDSDGAAEYVGLSRKALYALVERRRIPVHRPAGRLLFDKAELRAWVEAGR
jgi:excisionase family DNA binding protein